MNDQQPISPRRRQQELLAIPERQRTDAEWDELNELEITLASVNRVEAREPNVRRSPSATSDQPNSRRSPSATSDQPKSGDRPQGKRPARKFHKRPPKANTP
jgi:hypothetical protein